MVTHCDKTHSMPLVSALTEVDVDVKRVCARHAQWPAHATETRSNTDTQRARATQCEPRHFHFSGHHHHPIVVARGVE